MAAQTQRSRDLGYTDHGYVVLDDTSWFLVAPDQAMSPGDQLYDWSTRTWVDVPRRWNGRLIAANEPPVRRRRPPAWSCGHLREAQHKRCPICWVIYGWPVQS